MQKYRGQRIQAIAGESLKIYWYSKRWMLLSIGVFMAGIALYILFTPQSTPFHASETTPVLADGNTLFKLEDSISTTNEQLRQLSEVINLQLQNQKEQVTTTTNQVSDSNRQLIIKKIEAILRYVRTPLYQFNQLPTYFINNATLEKLIKDYNEEQMKVAKMYKTNNPYDSSLFKPLKSLQEHLTDQLEAERTVLIRETKQPIHDQSPNIRETSAALALLFDKKDSLTQIYSNQLERYEEQLDQISFTHLNGAMQSVEEKTQKTDDELRALHNPYVWLWGCILLLIAIVTPFLLIFYRKYKSPSMIRIEDIEIPDSEKNVKLELNKNVNKELIAFNYEQLIKVVDHLAKNRNALVTIYSVEAADQRRIIGLQMGALLAALGSSVLHIDLLNESDPQCRGAAHTFSVSEIITQTESIAKQVLQAAKHRLHNQVNIRVDELSLGKQNQISKELSYFWSLQHFFAKTEFKQMLATFKKHFAYIIINTPDFSELDSSLLFIPLKNINIHVFKSGTTQRKSANLVCKLHANESIPAIHIIDFSRTAANESLK